MARLSDDRIKSICESEIKSSTAWQSGELSDQRSTSMEYYLGEPYGDEEEGQSQVVTREVLDTVEWILPSLMKIFTDQDNAVEFSPRGQEDEKAAEQETDVVTHVCWQQNDGFLNLYTAIKDALLSKTGVLKIYWDDNPREEKEEYKGLNDIELSQLFQDKTVEREVIAYDTLPDGTHHIVVKTRSLGKTVIMPCPPDEVGVNRDARSANIQECKWVHHRSRKTKAELIEQGFDKKKIKSIPSIDHIDTQEELSRRHLEDEQDYNSPEAHWSLHTVYVTECYIRIDRDEDGVAELLKVTLATGSGEASTGSVLLDIEETDVIPFVSFSPILLTHKYYGLSVADMVRDIQRIKSALLRGALTNMYLANNQRVHINDRVNLDDLLTPRPGGIVRHKGNDVPANNFSPHPHQPVPQQCFDLLTYMDEERKDRVGVSDMTAGLDATSLAQVNTGVMLQAFDASRMKIELIARICAEIMLRPMYRMVHMLLRKRQTSEMIVRIRNEYISVDPSSWRERYDMTVRVGLGISSRERRLTALERVLAMQAQAGEMGVPVVLPKQAYDTLIDFTESLGLRNPEKYWQNPDLLPPPQPQPDPQMEALKLQGQAMVMEAQASREKNQVELMKIQSQEKLAIAEHQRKQQELELKGQIEDMKGQLQLLKTGTDAQREGSKQSYEQQKLMIEAQIRGVESMLRNHQEESKRELAQYQSELQSWTQLEQQRMSLVGQQYQAVQNKAEEVDKSATRSQGDMMAFSGNLTSAIQEMKTMLDESRKALEAVNAPRKRTIQRDNEGNVVSIDELPIIRDDDGMIVGLG